MKLTALLTAFLIFASSAFALAQSGMTYEEDGTRTIRAKGSKQKTTYKYPHHPYIITRPTYLFPKPVPHIYGHECTVTAGSRVTVVEQQVTDEMRLIRVTVTDGICKGRSGWIKTEYIKDSEEED